MQGKKTGKALPKRLKRGVERFENWRATRQKRRIPEALWKVAERLASAFPVFFPCIPGLLRLPRSEDKSSDNGVSFRQACMQRERVKR